MSAPTMPTSTFGSHLPGFEHEAEIDAGDDFPFLGDTCQHGRVEGGRVGIDLLKTRSAYAIKETQPFSSLRMLSNCSGERRVSRFR